MNRDVAQAFKKLYFGKRTGVLSCLAGSVRRGVFFRSGFVVGAKSNLNEDRLGEVMIRHGRITKQQFDDASHFIKSGWRLGEILAELKVIQEEEIEQYVRIQLLDIACMQLITPPERLDFSALSAVDAFIDAPLSVADILMEAARRTSEIDSQRAALEKERRRIGFARDPLKRFQEINLDPEEAFVLSRIDGTQTVAEIFAVSPLSEEQTARTLLGLLEAEVVEPLGADEPAPPEESEPEVSEEEPADDEPVGGTEVPPTEIEELFEELQDQDHWEVLRLERGATKQDVKDAFFAAARRYHPDRFRRINDAEFHEKVSYIFCRIQEAYETLSSEAVESYRVLSDKENQYKEARKSWDGPEPFDPQKPPPTMDPVKARALYQGARTAYESGDFWQTIQLAQEAIDIVTDEADYYHLLGLALEKNPKWRQDAEKNFKIAANQDPWKAEYLVSLGKLYEKGGLHLRARKTFEQAKAIDPTLDLPLLD